jgi:hypothetical protein
MLPIRWFTTRAVSKVHFRYPALQKAHQLWSLYKKFTTHIWVRPSIETISPCEFIYITTLLKLRIEERLQFVRRRVCARLFTLQFSSSPCEGVADGVSGRAFRRAIWSNAQGINMKARGATIREWLAECQTHHADCRKTISPETPLAARILAVHECEPNHFSTASLTLS